MDKNPAKYLSKGRRFRINPADIDEELKNVAMMVAKVELGPEWDLVSHSVFPWDNEFAISMVFRQREN